MEKENTVDLIYSSGEVAKHFDVDASTVRKWSLALEKHGYAFQKNGNRRVFSEQDMDTFKQLQTLLKSMDLDTGTQIIASQQGIGEKRAPRSTDTELMVIDEYKRDLEGQFQSLVAQFHARFEQQEEYIKSLEIKLQRYEQTNADRLEERDRNLMQVLRESQEAKAQMLETQAQVSVALEDIEKLKAPFWKRWFK